MLDNKYNISIWQGSTFTLTIRLTDANNVPRDISGFSARMQIRSSYASNTIIETLSTSNNEISIANATAGEIHLELSADRTSNIPVDLSILSNVRLSDGTNTKLPKQEYVYDFELIDDSSKVSKIMFGDVTVYGEVTR